jgi:HD-like signal output (HDOD) protein
MLLGVVSVLVAVLIGAAIWLLMRQPERAREVPTETAIERVFDNPEITPPARTEPSPQTPSPAEEASLVQAATEPQTPGIPEAIPEVVPLSSEEVFTRLHQLSLGISGVGEPWPQEHEEIIEATAGVLHNATIEDRYAPRRPSLLPQLMSAVNDEDASRRELVTIISRDPSLVGNLLKMANSPFYRVSSQAVESIDRAVVLLGNDGIRWLIAAALTQPIFQIRGGKFPKFPEISWEHTFRSASATVTHAVLVEKSDPFAAQLLGLVAGMAGIVVFRVALDQYDLRPKLPPHAGVIASLLDMQSAAAAKRIAKSWGLSDRILAALDDQTNAAASDQHTALGRSLTFGRLASALAVLHVNESLDDVTAQASMPGAGMPATELGRLWTRLTAEQDATARKKPRSAAAH